MEACLRTAFNIPPRIYVPIDPDTLTSDAEIVWHEAGHATVSELLTPGSVALVLARADDEGNGGSTTYREIDRNSTVKPWERGILVSLAGRAAVELRFGTLDSGASEDLDKVFREVGNYIENLCGSGFALHDPEYRSSESLLERQELATAAEVERNYRKVKEMLCANMGFLEALARALAEKGVLTAADIRAIRERCAVTKLAG